MLDPLDRLRGWWQRATSKLLSSDAEKRHRLRVSGLRVIGLVNIALGFAYMVWRYTSSLNMDALWFAIPLVLCETYSYLGTIMFVFRMWKPALRVAPPLLEGATVDVFITTYNEPTDLVRLTTEAATRLTWPDTRVYILDDGARPSMEALAKELRCGYIVRGEEWAGKSRHAKAGNVNNALLHTSGEFILLLDADQIPAPDFVERCVGYFRDPRLAFVQTPQYFYNIPPGDPFGSDALLFYGPMLKGMDGWNAGFLCGSNALLRREALMQLGLIGYVQEMERRVEHALFQMGRDLVEAQGDTLAQRVALASVGEALVKARQVLQEGQPLEVVSDIIRDSVTVAQEHLAQQDLAAIMDDLKAMADSGSDMAAEASSSIEDRLFDLVGELVDHGPTGADSVGLAPKTMEDLDLTRADEALPISALSTISITEDLATALRLHAAGWNSVFHPEVLAYGLAPEDLGSSLRQRLRWAQGTIQVLMRENPLFIRGLTFPQRIQYFTTMYSYFSGFSSLIYLLAPIIFLSTNISPVSAWSSEFALRLLPYMLVNRILFTYVTWGISAHRAEQYNLALFPLWIQAITSVVTGAKLKFDVTPKQRQSGVYLKLVWPQIGVIAVTVLAVLYGWFSISVGWSSQIGGVAANTFWGLYNAYNLWPIVRAAVYEPPSDWQAHPPDFLFPDRQPIGSGTA